MASDTDKLMTICQKRRSSAASAARLSRAATGSRKITAPGSHAMTSSLAAALIIVASGCGR
jgi:hypothetical protein